MRGGWISRDPPSGAPWDYHDPEDIPTGQKVGPAHVWGRVSSEMLLHISFNRRLKLTYGNETRLPIWRITCYYHYCN